MIGFLNPALLLGLFAAAIPLILHLSQSRRMHRMEFSSTRFFNDQFMRSYRMSRLKEIALLLLRMALVALLAMALAQPLVRTGGGVLAGNRRVALVLDDSASMRYIAGGRPLFDQALDAARALLDSFAADDRVSIVLGARRGEGPQVLFDQPVAPAVAREALARLRATTLATDLTAALGTAESIVRSGAGNAREVYVLSDLQRSAWPAGGAARPAGTGSEALFFLVNIGAAEPENLALTAVQYTSLRPIAGLPFGFRPHIWRQGGSTGAGELALSVEGRKTAQLRLDQLKPGRWTVPLVHQTFEADGWQTGCFEIEDSRFPDDNRRWFAVNVLSSIRLLAVNGAPSAAPGRDELFFLKRALQATADKSETLPLDEIAPAQLAQHELAPYHVIILANVANLAPEAVARLEEHVARGGSMLVFLGDRPVSASYNQLLASAARPRDGLLPARLISIAGDPSGAADVTTISAIDYENPMLAAFADPGFVALAGIGFKAYWRLEPRAGQVLIRGSNGDPLLCEKRYGKGRVLLFASACDRDWSHFPVRPAYLPWLHRAIAYLAEPALGATGHFTTGQPIPIPLPGALRAEDVAVVLPDGSTAKPQMVIGQDREARFAATETPGIYRIRYPRAGKDNREGEQVVAVNLDAAESDFTPLDEAGGGGPLAALKPRENRGADAFRELFPNRTQVRFVADPSNLLRIAAEARHGLPLWNYFLVLALLAALIEPWVANRISARKLVEQSPQKSGATARPWFRRWAGAREGTGR